MDSQEAAKRYMVEYNKLVEKYDNEAIHKLIEDMNKAIKSANIENINLNYNKLSAWNEYVANIQGARLALNAQFRHIKLPAVAEFLILFDSISKEWRFNTEAE